MNAKKKNKKANKPPNPKPPQNLKTTPKSEVPKCQSAPDLPKDEVKEKKVVIPEISSKVVTAPVCIQEIKDIDSETPKKPKRNKGKKNKQDKEEEFIEDEQGEPKEIQNEPILNVADAVQKIVEAEMLHEEKKGPSDESSEEASARKKKNKKKNQEKQKEELNISHETLPVPVPPPLPSPPEESKADNAVNIDSEIQELFSSKPDTSKQDTKKKRNKKKKRTDSERSDKSDSAMSFTSDLQKKIIVDESLKISKQDLTDVIVEGNQGVKTNISLEPEREIISKSVQAISDIQLLEETKEATKNESGFLTEHPKDELRNKKKNKKEKKESQKEQVEDINVTVQDTPITVGDILNKKMLGDEPKIDITEITEMSIESKVKREPSPSRKDQHQSKEPMKIPEALTVESQPDLIKEKEPSPKPKAKIAKPVEKKRKGRYDSETSDNLSNIESLEIMKEDNKDVKLSTDTEIKLEDIPTDNKTISEVSNQTIPGSTVVAIPIENISIPCDNSMGKKRKKSPKPLKNKEVHTLEAEMVNLLEKPQPAECIEIKEARLDVIDASCQPDKITSKALETPFIQMLKSLTDIKIESSDTELLERSATPEAKNDDDGFETKPNKKKKKTSKTPQANVESEVRDLKTPEIIKSEENQEKSEQMAEVNKNVSSDVPFPVELEVCSVKIEETEASSCELVPDVLFIRSSSQHLDDNNNTVIQEIILVDDTNNCDSLVIPLIEGSGETPARTPEIVSSGIRMTEFEPKTSTEEKTDIKSKMVEVNQDMEELRLSIERSLAEFTALEMCEEEQEKKFEADNSLKKEKSPQTIFGPKPTIVEETKIMSEIKENIPKGDNKESYETNLATPTEVPEPIEIPPVCPSRKDNKGKSKNKKKGKQETATTTTATTTASSELTYLNTSQPKDDTTTQTKEEKQEKTEQKSDQKSESSQDKGKQQSTIANDPDSKDCDNEKQPINTELISDLIRDEQQNVFEPIENFEDALTSSVDDLNKTFEMIAKQADDENEKLQKKLAANKPEINIIEPKDDTDTNRNEKVNPVSQPKNLLGHTDIPVQSNKTDYKKEKNKTPNARQATVKIKDSTDVETKKQSKECQTDNKGIKKNSDVSVKESFTRVKNDNEEYVYKYSFRKVFLQSACLVCNKDLSEARVPCGYCSLVFYCGARHREEDWPLHQALCFAVLTLAHMKAQKHIYADAQHATGQDYRLLRMQMIVSCEKLLKRRLVPWEQEAMLYPRLCADAACREWRQDKLRDCDGCGQVSFCAAHAPAAHARWCGSYSLYRDLVSYQQSRGRLDPPTPTKVLTASDLPDKMDELLASLFEEKLDLKDMEYAALTQLATAPLTTARALQLCRAPAATAARAPQKQLTVHVVGAELQLEADALHKWERFLLHLGGAERLAVVLVGRALNPARLPLHLLASRRLCDNCQQHKRRVVFKFEDNKNYFEYCASDDFIQPDIICSFNPSIERACMFGAGAAWRADIDAALRLRRPLLLSACTLTELRADLARVKQLAQLDFNLILEPALNEFASVRPDRNFISDDEMPLLFKNYCVAVLIGC